MTHELRQIIADLAEGRCVPSMQKRAAEMLRVAEQMHECLKWYVANDDTNIGQPGNEPWEAGLREAQAVLADAADLFFYADEEAANADAS